MLKGCKADLICNTCKEQGHVSRYCKMRWEKPACSACGDKTHFLNNCNTFWKSFPVCQLCWKGSCREHRCLELKRRKWRSKKKWTRTLYGGGNRYYNGRRRIHFRKKKN